MTDFKEKLKTFAAAQRLNSGLKDSHSELVNELSLGIERQISHYYDQVKKTIMSDFEKELDILIKESKKILKTKFETNGELFTLSGSLPTL